MILLSANAHHWCWAVWVHSNQSRVFFVCFFFSPNLWTVDQLNLFQDGGVNPDIKSYELHWYNHVFYFHQMQDTSQQADLKNKAKVSPLLQISV